MINIQCKWFQVPTKKKVNGIKHSFTFVQKLEPSMSNIIFPLKINISFTTFFKKY